MYDDLLKAKNILLEKGYTCVLRLGEIEYHSTLRGVKPLIDFLESNRNFNGFCAADRVVGAGAAHLYVLLGAKAVWAQVISEGGKNILQRNNVSVFCENVVPNIINRKGDGTCPIEASVNGITDSKIALATIKLTLQKLTQKD